MENIKLIQGDCVEVMKDIKDNSIDLTITSPPYDCLRTYENSCEWNFDIFKKVAQELYRITKVGGVVVWVVNDGMQNNSESGTSFKQALYFKDIGFNIHDTMIWDKGSFAFPSNNRYHQVWEFMFVFSKGLPSAFNPIKDRVNLYIGERGASGRKSNGERNKGKSVVRNALGQRFNIWHYPIGGGHSTKDKIAFEHPAIFPEKLAYDHIISWSNEGDVVLDCFMGSGTVGKMAILSNRKFIGIEKVESYFNIAKKRIDGVITTPSLF